jgi:putative RNase toxin 28 of polymorphic toxin system
LIEPPVFSWFRVVARQCDQHRANTARSADPTAPGHPPARDPQGYGARRDLNGEVVAREGDGTPWDHFTEVREAQNGLTNQINRLKRQFSDSRLAPEDRPTIEAELSEASRLLDYSEQWVPRG